MSVSRWLRESTVDRRKFLAQAGGMSAVLATAACASSDPVTVTVTTTPGQTATGGAVTVPPAGGATTSASAVATTGAASTARIIASPKFGSTDVAPTAGVTITTFNAKITDLTVTGSDGRTVTGTIDSGGATWTLTDRLRFDTVYTFAGTATDTAGTATPIEGQLTTVAPADTLDALPAYATEGGTYGVGQPVIIQFNGVVTNRAAAQERMKVTTDKGDVIGSWGWLQDEDIVGDGLRSQVHWRPQEFWPANTTVTVTMDLYGVDFGDGKWGTDDTTLTFTIGRKLVAFADVTTFRLRVEQDDVEIKNYPVSYGKADNGRVTRSGIHLVQDKIPSKNGAVPTYSMCNAAFGYCGVDVTWPVRINNNGEFIHENDSTIPYQGVANVSHGCVNMSTANAKDFYNLVIIGDPVIVSNTGGDMTAADFNYDWIYSYDAWKGLSAL